MEGVLQMSASGDIALTAYVHLGRTVLRERTFQRVWAHRHRTRPQQSRSMPPSSSGISRNAAGLMHALPPSELTVTSS